MAKTAVIGADVGIANHISRQLAARGDEVYATLLGGGADFDGQAVEVIPHFDVTQCDSVNQGIAELSGKMPSIDVFYHVAGVMTIDTLDTLDFEKMRWEYEVNAMGPLRTIAAARSLLKPGSRVGVVTSRVGSLGDNSGGQQYSYRMSKCAANMAGLNLHVDLSRQGIAVRMLHPGMVQTDLVKDYPGDFDYITPAQAAEGLIKQMDELTLETSGQFRHGNGTELIW